MRLGGEYFAAGSSRSAPANITLKDGRADIVLEVVEVEAVRDPEAAPGGSVVCEGAAIQSVQNRQSLYLEDGGLFVLKEKLTLEEAKALSGRLASTLSWLEVFTLKKAALLSLILIAAVVAFRLLLSSLVQVTVAVFPAEWERRIGKNTYESLLLGPLEPSLLPRARIDGLIRKTQALAGESSLAGGVELKVHSSDLIGANALAFPGGPIVITDDLIIALGNDDEILAVLAHELAHVEERHFLQRIVEVVGLGVAASVLFGADDSLIEEASTAAIGLWSLKASRDFEKQADLAAMDLLRKSGIGARHFVNAIEKITALSCGRAAASAREECSAGAASGWLSTHPSGAERLDYLTENLQAGKN